MRGANGEASALMMLLENLDQPRVSEDAPVHQKQQLPMQIHGMRQHLLHKEECKVVDDQKEPLSIENNVVACNKYVRQSAASTAPRERN